MALGLLNRKQHKEVGKVVLIPVDRIVPNPNQPRKHFDPDAMQELCRSIITNNLLQPVTVRQISDNRYELIAGERRTMAFRNLGREFIPAIVEEYTDEQSAVLALIENMQRKDLNYFEEAVGIARLMKELSLTQQQVSQRLGKAQSTVANKLRLLRYPPELMSRMLEHNLTERHARALLRLPDLVAQEQAVTYIIDNALNVEQTERYVKKLMMDRDKPDKPKNTRVFVVKDMRIFLNSLNKAVDMMNMAGIPVDVVKNEGDVVLEYTVKIPKSMVYRSKPERKAAAGS